MPGNEELLPPFTVARTAAEDGAERFDAGEMVCFGEHRKHGNETATFDISGHDELPSIALNPQPGDSDEDVRERGRLKFTADALDFFSKDGETGVSASNRIKGVVLHDILSHVNVPEDLESAVRQAVQAGELTGSEADEAYGLLSERIAAAADRGWFPSDADRILNEASLIDTDGQMCRPDRVVIADGKVIIIDYKFGEHHRIYERQLKKYAGIWNRLGYEDVTSYLWYVHTDEVVKV